MMMMMSDSIEFIRGDVRRRRYAQTNKSLRFQNRTIKKSVLLPSTRTLRFTAGSIRIILRSM